MKLKQENGNIKMIMIVIIVIILVVLGIYLFTKKDVEALPTKIARENYEYFTLLTLDEKVGVISKTGEMIIDPIYTEIYIPNQTKDVFICVGDDQYQILNAKGEEIFKNFSEISGIMISENTLEMEEEVLVYQENGLYGLVDLSEKKLTDAIYEEISSLPNKPGNLLVKKDGLYGVLDTKGNTIIPVEYYSVKSDEYCSETDGYAKTGYIISEKAKTGILYGYVDYTGKVLIKPKYESISRALAYDEKDIFLIVMENGKKGVIKNKKPIIKNNFQSINYYDVSKIFIVEKNGKYGFYNHTGKEIIKPQYTSYSIAGNYIFVKKDETSQLFDLHGNLVNTNNYKTIIETENPSFFIAEDETGYYSIISKDIQINEHYTNISYAFDNFFIFTNEQGKSGVLNVYTGIEIEPEYDSILLTGTVNALEARKENIVDIYSQNLEKVLTMENGIVENIGTDFLVVHSDKQMQYFGKNGEIVANTEVYPNQKLYTIQKDGKWGFTDNTGKVVVDCKYDMVTELNSYGFAGICQDGKWGVIDEKGKVIVVPSYEIETYYAPQFIGKYKLEDYDNWYCTEIAEQKTGGK